MGPHDEYEPSAEELMSDAEAEQLIEEDLDYNEAPYGEYEIEEGYEYADWM